MKSGPQPHRIVPIPIFAGARGCLFPSTLHKEPTTAPKKMANTAGSVWKDAADISIPNITRSTLCYVKMARMEVDWVHTSMAKQLQMKAGIRLATLVFSSFCVFGLVIIITK